MGAYSASLPLGSQRINPSCTRAFDRARHPEAKKPPPPHTVGSACSVRKPLEPKSSRPGPSALGITHSPEAVEGVQEPDCFSGSEDT